MDIKDKDRCRNQHREGLLRDRQGSRAQSEDEGVAANASNSTDDKFVSVLTEEAFSTVRQEVGAFIDAMDEDEQCELVALAWVGRGEFSAEERDAAVAQARERRSARRPPSSRHPAACQSSRVRSR